MKFAVMGAGKITKDFCAGVKLVPDAEVVVVISKDLARGETFAKEAGIPHFDVYENLEKYDVDAVYIGTTNNYHYENICQCIAAGKHVLCEKPMVMTVKECEDVIARAKEKGVFLMEAMWARFLPKSDVIRGWMKDGRIGTPRLLQASIGYCAQKDYGWRLYNKELGGGAMYDIGVYLLDMIPYLACEEIQSVTGHVVKYAPTGVDETISMEFQLDNIFATGLITFEAAVSEECLIFGEGGYIRAPHIHWGRDAILYDAGGNVVEEFKGDWSNNGMHHETIRFMECIAEGLLECPEAPLSMSLKNAQIYEQILGK